MNIAMTASALPSDSRVGAGYQAHYLANALVQMGHQLTMFSMSPKPEDALYHHQLMPRSPRATIWRYALDLRGLDLRGFDVLHCNGDDCFLLGKKRPRHIRTLHGASWAEARSSYIWKHRLRILALAAGEHLSLRVANLCVANSKSTLRYFPSVHSYIPCGVDLEVFRSGGEKTAHPTILFVGGIQSKKRGWLMLETFQKEVRRQIPNAELWVVSGEPVEGEGVRFFGKVDTPTLVSLYQSAWLFCMPSSYEGFGVPYIEAMACGTPVVATYNDGANEVLANGQYGLLSHDDQLGDSLIKVLTDADLRYRLTETGLQRAQDYSWDRVTSQYVAAYTDQPWDGR
jgi:phosphatidylinositol alpha-mannosyltransferase